MSLAATERLRAKVRQQRVDWFIYRLPAIATFLERVVFIDEIAVKTNLTRLRGRAKRGQRLTMDTPFGSWGTQTLIASMTPDALIAPGTVVILDNLATHQNKGAAQALRAHGCWFLVLPPYSPDLNPTEQTFLKLKTHLRRIGVRTFSEAFEAFGAICDPYDPTECWNYFKAAGYVSS